jgi:hypothetical protein
MDIYIFIGIYDTTLVSMYYLIGICVHYMCHCIGIHDSALDSVTGTPHHHMCHLDHLLRVHLSSWRDIPHMCGFVEFVIPFDHMCEVVVVVGVS